MPPVEKYPIGMIFARRIWTFPYISGLGEDLAGDGGDGAALGGVRAAGPVSDAVRPEEVLGRRRGRGRGGVARGRRGAPGAHAAVELVLLREDILVAQHGRGRGHH